MTDADATEMLEAARGYERLFVPALFAPWTKHLIDGAGVREGSHVLDIACGTGVLARAGLERAGPAGRVVGLDPAPGMIGVARELSEAIEWVNGSAEDMAFDDASFDCVVSQFGMMFFQDRPAAVRQMHRVLRPGGALAVAVWDDVGANPAYSAVSDLLDQQVGTAAGDAIRLPFSLGNKDIVAALLRGAGFDTVDVETRTETARFPSARHLVEAELRGWLPLFDIHLDEDQISSVLAASDTALAGYAGPDGQAVFPTSAHIFRARKP